MGRQRSVDNPRIQDSYPQEVTPTLGYPNLANVLIETCIPTTTTNNRSPLPLFNLSQQFPLDTTTTAPTTFADETETELTSDAIRLRRESLNTPLPSQLMPRELDFFDNFIFPNEILLQSGTDWSTTTIHNSDLGLLEDSVGPSAPASQVIEINASLPSFGTFIGNTVLEIGSRPFSIEMKNAKPNCIQPPFDLDPMSISQNVPFPDLSIQYATTTSSIQDDKCQHKEQHQFLPSPTDLYTVNLEELSPIGNTIPTISSFPVKREQMEKEVKEYPLDLPGTKDQTASCFSNKIVPPKHRDIQKIPENFEVYKGVKISKDVWARAWMQPNLVKKAIVLFKSLFLPQEICMCTKSGRASSLKLDPTRLQAIRIAVWWMNQNQNKNPYSFNPASAIPPPKDKMEEVDRKVFVETRNGKRIQYKGETIIKKRKAPTDEDPIKGTKKRRTDPKQKKSSELISTRTRRTRTLQ